jgi:positive regulator of sigma E activity
MLSPLGVIFGLLVAFVAVQVWNDFDKAKLAVAAEASALRAVALLAENLPDEQRTQLRALINRHVDEAVNREWPAMAHEHLTLTPLSTHLVEALQLTISLKPQDESQRTAQREIVAAVRTALVARRQRIIISQSEVGPVKWAAILLQGLCTLIAIAMVHSDNRHTCAIAVAIFATGIALSSLLIAAYSRPFAGEISVGPELLQQVIPKEMATMQPNGH